MTDQPRSPEGVGDQAGARASSSAPAAPGPAVTGELFEQVVGQVGDYAIFALNPLGVIETWNLGAQRLKGYTADEAVGRDFSIFYPEDDRRDGLPARLLLEARRSGRVQHTGWRLRKDGSRFWGDVTITALRDSEGNLTGFAKITRDRSDVKALEDAQESFYAAFNHDFHTPMIALKGFAGSLREAPEELREQLIERIEASSDRLLQMAEDLLEFVRHRATGHAMLVDDIDIAQVIRDAVHQLGPDLQPERVVVPRDMVALARANGVATQRIVTNLVINALRYSPKNSPVLATVRQSTSSTVPMVELVVADRGRGIHPDDLDVIFEEFQRGRLSENDDGSGLGLASVKQLVEQQGGSVTIHSEPGVGTQVVVQLPAS